MINKSALLLQENFAGGDEVDKVAEAVAVLGESGGETVDFAAVNRLQPAAGGVGEHFLGETPGKIRLAL